MILTDLACTWSAHVDETIATDPLYRAPVRGPRELNDPQPPRTALDDVVTRPVDHPRYDWYDAAGIPLEVGHTDPRSHDLSLTTIRRCRPLARRPYRLTLNS